LKVLIAGELYQRWLRRSATVTRASMSDASQNTDHDGSQIIERS
jgi:hypothetical protein